MSKAIVVNCSKPYYNLGAQKLTDWLRDEGYRVHYSEGDPGLFGLDADLICLSVIFSWHAPVAVEIALRMKDKAEVWCGGPGMFALVNWWKEHTGLECTRGLDPRFEQQRGDYRMTFASRGCPVNCYFCIVPRIEGTQFTLDWEFRPAQILCDNNLSALPAEFQDHIIERYRNTGVALRDANSGFEPRTFTEDTYQRWKPILKGPWRFALDDMVELPDVERVMRILKAVSSRRKQVYVLVGNEPIEACYERAIKVIEWGGEPYCQPLIPLNALSRDHLKVAYDWTWQKLKDFTRYFNRHIWRSIKLAEYSNRKGEQPPFANISKFAGEIA